MKHLLFWTAFVNIIYAIGLLVFILWASTHDTITITYHKQMGLFFLPLLINLILMFSLEYCILTDNYDETH